MLYHTITIGFILFFLIACDAPRYNPLDPHNPDRQFVSLQGQVSTVSMPHQPLAGVTIYSKEEQLFLISDAQGYFSADNIQPLNDWLFFEKEGFQNDSLYLDWKKTLDSNLDVYLNALPQLDSLIFFSSLSNRYPDIQILELIIQAQISDPDNDIDSVFLKNDFFQFSTMLSFNTELKSFEKKHITLAELGVKSAEEIIGHPFDLIVKDSFGHSLLVQQSNIRRIIRDEVDPKSPAGGETVSTLPLLRWEPVNPGYDFTYQIEIRTDEPDPRLVWQKEGLPPGSSSAQVDIALATTPINSYIWAVWIIDNFGNRARSKYKSFQVE